MIKKSLFVTFILILSSAFYTLGYITFIYGGFWIIASAVLISLAFLLLCITGALISVYNLSFGISALTAEIVLEEIFKISAGAEELKEFKEKNQK